MKKKFKTT